MTILVLIVFKFYYNLPELNFFILFRNLKMYAKNYAKLAGN